MVHACGISDVGRVRKTNEDGCVSDLELGLFAVADGMGGHNAGEVASGLALETVAAFIRRSSGDTDFSWPYGLDRSISFDGNRLRTAVNLANRRVFRAAEHSDEYSGMGTTFVGALLFGARVSIAHVGDSRLYLMSGGELQQLTTDDSWAATVLAQDATIKPEDIARHPMHNVLTSVLGARDHVDVHVSERKLQDGDLLMLCSDGVHGSVDAETMRAILDGTSDVEGAARALVEMAMARGSRDNVTALVVRYEDGH